jgi:hypothetical protein
MRTHVPTARPTLSFVAILLTALTSCASTSAHPGGTARSETAEHAGPMHGNHHHGMMGMCPMNVPGTAATVTDVEGAVAISFTTRTGDVAELRRRVRHMAEMHAQHQGCEMHQMKMVPSTATVVDIDGGARMVLVPNDPAQLAALRQHARDHATMMASGRCPMMEHG